MSPAPIAAEPRHAPNSMLVWGLAVGTTVSWGILFYAFSLFVTPMEADLGWSRTELNAALTVGLLAAGAVAIPFGRIIDRRGGRVLMPAAALLGAAMFLVWAWTADYRLFLIVWIGIGIAQAGALYEPVFAVVTANVKDYKRAITFVTFLGGFASTIFLPVTHLLIETFGWRHALMALAAIQLVFAFGLYVVVLPGTRGSLEGLPPKADGTVHGGHMARALRSPAFWGLFATFLGYGFMWSAVTFHIIPLLIERGLGLDMIVAALALVGPAQVAGRVILFFFGANASARDVGRFVVLLPVAAVVLLATVAPLGFVGLAIYAIVYGLGNGMITIVRGAGVAEILGREGYGEIAGAITVGNTVAKAAGPLAVAYLWTVFGGYGPILWIWGVVMVASAAAFWYAATRKPTPQE